MSQEVIIMIMIVGLSIQLARVHFLVLEILNKLEEKQGNNAKTKEQ